MLAEKVWVCPLERDCEAGGGAGVTGSDGRLLGWGAVEGAGAGRDVALRAGSDVPSPLTPAGRLLGVEDEGSCAGLASDIGVGPDTPDVLAPCAACTQSPEQTDLRSTALRDATSNTDGMHAGGHAVRSS